MKRISENEMLMLCAEQIALRSTCARAQVGAVLARRGRIIATGYNGTPSGMAHCDHACNCFSPSHMAWCRSRKPCLDTVHAEANAIVFAARHGQPVEGATLYCTITPCLNCAQLIINAGISMVYIRGTYRLETGRELLTKAGIQWHWVRSEQSL